MQEHRKQKIVIIRPSSLFFDVAFASIKYICAKSDVLTDENYCFKHSITISFDPYFFAEENFI